MKKVQEGTTKYISIACSQKRQRHLCESVKSVSTRGYIQHVFRFHRIPTDY